MSLFLLSKDAPSQKSTSENEQSQPATEERKRTAQPELPYPIRLYSQRQILVPSLSFSSVVKKAQTVEV